MWLDIVAVIVGIALVLFFAGRLVRGTIGFARGFGLSAFLLLSRARGRLGIRPPRAGPLRWAVSIC